MAPKTICCFSLFNYFLFVYSYSNSIRKHCKFVLTTSVNIHTFCNGVFNEVFFKKFYEVTLIYGAEKHSSKSPKAREVEMKNS